MSIIHRTVSKEEEKRLKRVIDQLPFDCWSNVLIFMSHYSEFLTIVVSVKGLHEYIKFQNAYCTRNINFKIIDFPKRGTRYQYVHKIQISEPEETKYFQNMEERLLESTRTTLFNKLLPFFPNLKCVNFDGQLFPKRKHKVHLGKSLKEPMTSLKELVISESEEIDLNIYYQKFPNLESLELEGSSRNYFGFWVFGEGTEPPMKNLKELRIISKSSLLEDVTMFFNPDFFNILKNQLRVLEITGKTHITEISGFPVLEHLVICCGLKKISNLPRIRKLEHKYCGICKIEFETLNSEMEYLELCHFTREDDLQRDICRFQNLKELLINVKVCLDEHQLADFETDLEVECYDMRKTIELKEIPPSVKKLMIFSERSDIKAFGKGFRNIEDLKLHIGLRDLMFDFKLVKSTLKRLWIDLSKLIPMYSYGFDYDYALPVQIEDEKREILERIGNIIKEKDNDDDDGNNNNESKLLQFQDFINLKEMRITGLNFVFKNKVNLEISNCKKLTKFTYHQEERDIDHYHLLKLNPDKEKELLLPEIPPNVVLKKLPSLRHLSFENCLSNLIEVQECPNIEKLELRACKMFPKGIKKEKVTDLLIHDCLDGLLEDHKIDGNVFKSLKYLSVSQKWPIFEFSGHFTHDMETIKIIRNLTELWKLTIRSNFLELSGIEEISGLSEHVDINLVLKGGVARDSKVQKSMDKKRFYKSYGKVFKKN